MDSVEQDDRDDIVWSDAQAIIRGLEEHVALLTRELQRAGNELEILRAETAHQAAEIGLLRRSLSVLTSELGRHIEALDD